MEKTFEELLTDEVDFVPDMFGRETVLKLLQQVREATTEEFCQALLDVPLPAGTVRKIGKIAITTDRIKTDK